VGERPGYCDFAGRTAVLRADCAEPIDMSELPSFFISRLSMLCLRFVLLGVTYTYKLSAKKQEAA